jgi:HAD superfamily 5'-nucleotidase-like hydrolase
MSLSDPHRHPGPADASVPESHGHYLPGEKNVPRQHRIFTNRNLRMDQVRALGFDMDHTLALYNRDTFEPLTFRMAVENLIANLEYPEAIRDLEYDPDFTIRGLIVDKRYGNLLKMDFHGYLARAYHGLTPLKREQRKRWYRATKVNLRSSRYVSFDTFFSMPEGSLFAALVALKESGGKGGPLKDVPISRMYDDVRESVDKIHRDGSLKRVIMGDLPRYFIQDDSLHPTLERFRAGGKKLFLVTNSEHEYTEAVLSHLLGNNGKNWRSLFDLIVVESKKPRFFMEKQEAQEIPGTDGLVFAGGNASFTEEKLGARGEEVLYFGDHTYGDILRSKKTVGWRTAMIVYELESEVLANKSQIYVLREIEDLSERRMSLDRDRDQLSLLVSVMRRLRAGAPEQMRGVPPWAREYTRRELEEFQNCSPEDQEKHIARLTNMVEGLDFLLQQTEARALELENQVAQAHNRLWGQTFREGNKLSRFGRQVRDFACIYTSRVSNFVHYPVNYYFIAPPERLPHEV